MKFTPEKNGSRLDPWEAIRVLRLAVVLLSVGLLLLTAAFLYVVWSA